MPCCRVLEIKGEVNTVRWEALKMLSAYVDSFQDHIYLMGV